MKNITSKNVKNYILDPTNDLEEVINFYELDYKSTIEGIFNSLFVMLKNYEQNRSRIDFLVNIIEELVDIRGINELKYMLGPIKNINNLINDKFSLKEKVVIRDFKLSICNIQNKINNTIISDSNNNKSKCIEYLVFQDKNLSMIDNIVNNSNYNDILSVLDKNGCNILESILKKYIYLDDKDEDEINYLFHVMHLFINSSHGESIIKDKNKYLNIIRKSKLMYKEHIIKVIELFNPDFKIDLSEIEDRYDVKFIIFI